MPRKYTPLALTFAAVLTVLAIWPLTLPASAQAATPAAVTIGALA